jgi:hypothetical protein
MRHNAKMKRAAAEHLIHRRDVNYFHGWIVSITRRGKVLVRHFSDKPGGRRVALQRARRYRDEMLQRLPGPTRIKSVYALNKTGIIGVNVVEDRTRAGRSVRRYTATWPTRDGGQRKQSFSTLKYGEAGARALAIAAREHGLHEEELASRLRPPKGREWKVKGGRDRK